MNFSTKDSDNDKDSFLCCTVFWCLVAGYNKCHDSDVKGEYNYSGSSWS